MYMLSTMLFEHFIFSIQVTRYKFNSNPTYVYTFLQIGVPGTLKEKTRWMDAIQQRAVICFMVLQKKEMKDINEELVITLGGPCSCQLHSIEMGSCLQSWQRKHWWRPTQGRPSTSVTDDSVSAVEKFVMRTGAYWCDTLLLKWACLLKLSYIICSTCSRLLQDGFPVCWLLSSNTSATRLHKRSQRSTK